MFQQDPPRFGSAAQAHEQELSAVLVVRHPPSDRGRQVPVAGGDMLIGRDEASDLILTDPSTSRRHAVIRIRDGEYVIEDLGSLNGTFLNGERVMAGKALRDGDELRFGHTVVEFSQAGSHRGDSGSAGPDRGSWRPNAPTQPIAGGHSDTGQRSDHSLRADLRTAPGFSPAALLLAVLGSVVGTVLISSLEGDAFDGPWWRLVGAAVGPVISTTFTTRRAGEKGRIRAAIIVVLSSGALLITVTGTSLTELARGASVISRTDEGRSTFPVPGLSDRMEHEQDEPSDQQDSHEPDDPQGSTGLAVDPGEIECETTSVGQEVVCESVFITNAGDEPLTVGLFDLQGHSDDFWAESLCGTEPLQPDESCEVLIAFAPTESGVREAELVIRNGASGETVTVWLMGTASIDQEPTEG